MNKSNFQFNSRLWDFGGGEEFIEVANYAALPVTGEDGKIYVTLDNNKLYRWTGSTYVEISASVSPAWGGITGTLSNQTDLQIKLNEKQDLLVSGSNIKTINGNSVLGSGDIILDSWNKTGNASTNPVTDFLGTSDAQPLIFRTNNIESARIFSSTRNWNIGGTVDAGYKLDVNGTGIFRGDLTVNKGNSTNLTIGSNISQSQSLVFADWDGNSTISHTVQNNPGYVLNPLSGAFNFFVTGVGGGSLGSPKINQIISTANWGNTYPSQTEGGWHIHFANSVAAVTTATRAFKITPDRRAFWYNKTGDIVVGDTDSFTLYANDVTAGNSAPHFRTENGSIIKLYSETTSVASSTLISNGGTVLTDTDTIDGYTLKQVVKALRNQGLLA